MNDNNKRLTELLGIEPKYKCSKDIYNNMWEFKELVDVIDRHNLNYPDDRWCLDDFEEVFPDFQEPENFVKLLRLELKEDEIIGATFGCIFNRYNFEECLISLLIKRLPEHNLKNIKQQAQKVNWKY